MIKNDPKLKDLHDLPNKDILKRIKSDDALVELRQDLDEKMSQQSKIDYFFISCLVELFAKKGGERTKKIIEIMEKIAKNDIEDLPKDLVAKAIESKNKAENRSLVVSSAAGLGGGVTAASVLSGGAMALGGVVLGGLALGAVIGLAVGAYYFGPKAQKQKIDETLTPEVLKQMYGPEATYNQMCKELGVSSKATRSIVRRQYLMMMNAFHMDHQDADDLDEETKEMN